MTEKAHDWITPIRTEVQPEIAEDLISSLKLVRQILSEANRCWKPTPSSKEIRKNVIEVLEERREKSNQLRSSLLFFDKSRDLEYEFARIAFPLPRHKEPFANLLIELDRTVADLDRILATLKLSQAGGRPGNDRIYFFVRMIGNSFQNWAPEIPHSALMSSLFYKVVERIFADADISVGDLRNAIKVTYGSD